MSFTIAQTKLEDISEISRIHMESFQGYFLNIFGEDFLKIYYRNYLANSEHILLSAKVDGKIIGFIAGTLDKNLLYQTLFNRYFFLIINMVFKKFITDKIFRNHIIRKGQYIKSAIKAKLFKIDYFNDSRDREKRLNNIKSCNLLSIAVLDEFKGTGASETLIRDFENVIKQKGASYCTLSVRLDNLRGIGFYKKTGWHVIAENKELISFKKELFLD